MKNTRIAIALAATVLVAQIAGAQMTGGRGGHQPGNPSNPGTGYGNGLMTGGGYMGAPNQLIVAPDGKVFTVRRSASSTDALPAIDIVSVLPSGTIAWSTALTGGARDLTLAGNLLVLAGGDAGTGVPANSADVKTLLTALSVVTGAKQWELEIDGRVQAIEPFAGGIYALVAEHDETVPTGTYGSRNGLQRGPGNGYGLGTRSLVAISEAGAVLWTVELN